MISSSAVLTEPELMGHRRFRDRLQDLAVPKATDAFHTERRQPAPSAAAIAVTRSLCSLCVQTGRFVSYPSLLTLIAREKCC